MLATTLLTGALAGALATAPMTFTMEVLHRRLPLPERYPLPPREVTMNIAARTGVKHRLRREERAEASLVAHFAYGALVGALYSALVDRVVRPSPLTGIIFGLGVWGASYLRPAPRAEPLPAGDAGAPAP
jgi:hypothetical protein